jgi:hypothetical protein
MPALWLLDPALSPEPWLYDPQVGLSGGLDAQRAGSGYASFMAPQHLPGPPPHQHQHQQHGGDWQDFGSSVPAANSFQRAHSAPCQTIMTCAAC